MSFAGGHHYRVAAGGFDADFFFIPVSPEFLDSASPAKENFGWMRLSLSLGEMLELAQSVVMEVNLSSEAAFDAGLDVVDGVIIGSLQLDPLASGVQGPLYQSSCTFVSDELGNSIPGDCACRFPTAAVVVPLYVPLGPLFDDEPGAPDADAHP